MNVSIIIPNFNGLQHLTNNLPTLVKATAQQPIEIIVVDNGSKDASIDYLKSTYPQITVISLSHPLGFSHTCNVGAKQARYPILFFLNNDVAVSEDFLPPLIKHFEDDKVFAVTPSIIVPRMENLNEALTTATYRGGAFNVDFYASRRWKKQPTTAIPILFGCGAALMVDKEKFEQLGGFDENFSPFYCEDMDLSYRAQRRGWKVLCEPKSVVHHLKEGTIAKEFGSKRIFAIRRKNQYLFIWKNVFDRIFLLSHFIEMLLPKLLLPNLTEWSALLQALRQLPAVLKSRKEERFFSTVTDRSILDKSSFLLKNNVSPKLSVLLITLDEEELIKQWLQQIALIDPFEIVIVDGGSTDNTLNIIRNSSLPINLIEHKMGDSFSEQRNIAKHACQGEWILQIDSDEILSNNSINLIPCFCNDKNAVAFYFPRLHLFPDKDHYFGNPEGDLQLRLFRNLKEIEYINSIHEQLAYRGEVIQPGITRTSGRWKWCRIKREIRILHYGYIKSKAALIERGKRWQKFKDASSKRGIEIGKEDFFLLDKNKIAIKQLPDAFK